jgi:hypothetical protein
MRANEFLVPFMAQKVSFKSLKNEFFRIFNTISVVSSNFSSIYRRSLFQAQNSSDFNSTITGSRNNSLIKLFNRFKMIKNLDSSMLNQKKRVKIHNVSSIQSVAKRKQENVCTIRINKFGISDPSSSFGVWGPGDNSWIIG